MLILESSAEPPVPMDSISGPQVVPISPDIPRARCPFMLRTWVYSPWPVVMANVFIILLAWKHFALGLCLAHLHMPSHHQPVVNQEFYVEMPHSSETIMMLFDNIPYLSFSAFRIRNDALSQS